MKRKIINGIVLSIGGLLVSAVAALAGGIVLPLAAQADTETSTAPAISAIAASPSDTGAVVTWTTDQPSNSQVAYGTTTPYNTFSSLDTSEVTSHSLSLAALLPGTLYHFQVMSENASSSLATSSDQTFLTTGAAASTATTTTATSSMPVISNILANPSGTNVLITWMTDQPATSQVLWGTTPSYGAATVVDSNLVTNHSMTVTDLSPNTDYHFQVLSGTNPGIASSSDQTFLSAMGTTTATSTPASSTEPVISGIVITPTDTGATVMWTTDENADSQVAWGISANNYTASTTKDTNQVMSHSVGLTGLTPNTTYHLQVWSMDGSGNTMHSTDQMFMTTQTSTTTPPTTPDLTTLQNEITDLQNRVTTLEHEIQALLGGGGTGGGGTGTTTPPQNQGPASIDQNGQTFSAGGSIDFGGRNFKHEENVTVTMNGTTVAMAHADNGGNFSTGSLSLPTAPGTYTYHFAGQNGDSVDATITLH